MKHGAMQKALVLAKIKANEKTKRPSWDNTRKGPWRGAARKAEGGPIDQPYNGPNLGPLAKGSAAPIDDWAVPPSTTNSAADDWVTPPSDKGIANAVAQGAAQGATFNFSDELRGLGEAGGLKPNEPSGLAPVLKGAYNYFSGDKDAEAAYNAAVARARAEDKTVEQQHPYAHIAGELVGGLAAPVGAAASGATMGARMTRGALAGAGAGAAYGAGEGENPTERITNAATGSLFGGLTGGVAPPLVEGAIQGVRRLAAPIVNTVTGAINPEAEAGRRVVTALQRDMQTHGPSMMADEIAAANAAGSPRAIIDAGDETTRALARSSANSSPEARAALTGLVSDRFGTQNQRASDFVGHLTGANADNPATLEALQQSARAANKPAYNRAYREGQTVWDSNLEQLTQAPAVQQAIKDATKTGANRAALDGFQPVKNPFSFDESGRMALKTNPDGSQALPSLQFWDHVKRNLDDQYNTAIRSGSKSEAADINGLRSSLLGHLDNSVPSYQAARAGAASAFGAQDALEAGSKFVSAKMDNAEARRAFNKMSPAEKQLFQKGYASTLMNQIGEMGDRRTILNTIAASPAARERMEIAFGPQKAKEMEAFLRVEGIMDRARNAVSGNSTTARQLAELGLAGGAYGIAGHGDLTDPRAVATGALVWGLAHGRHKIDERVAKRVGEMLASNDPSVLRKGIQMVARHSRILDGVRGIDGYGAKIGGQQTPFQMIPKMQGTMPARADQEQQQP